MGAIKTCSKFFLNTAHYLYRSRNTSSSVSDLQKAWADETLKRFSVDLEVTGSVGAQSPLLLIGNHITYLDIPILMGTVENISFVAKKELQRWPVIGQAAEAMKVIFVDRDSKDSRQAARKSIAEGFRNHRRIVIFPSGTTSVDESKPWRKGAFEIANEMGVPIQPFRLRYEPLRKTAFINDDLFPIHLYNLAKLPRIKASLEFHAPLAVHSPQNECQRWQSWTQERSKLQNFTPAVPI